LRPGVGIERQKFVNEALDFLRKNPMPMAKAMERTLLAGERIQLQYRRHRFQRGEMERLAVPKTGPPYTGMMSHHM
jgi:hypothetical protein